MKTLNAKTCSARRSAPAGRPEKPGLPRATRGAPGRRWTWSAKAAWAACGGHAAATAASKVRPRSKLLRAGLAHAVARTRLQRVGAILARLRHPGIAQLLDAGVSPQGQPYLLLEFVEGERIDPWCDAQALGVRPRVQRFPRQCRWTLKLAANPKRWISVTAPPWPSSASERRQPAGCAARLRRRSAPCRRRGTRSPRARRCRRRRAWRQGPAPRLAAPRASRRGRPGPAPGQARRRHGIVVLWRSAARKVRVAEGVLSEDFTGRDDQEARALRTATRTDHPAHTCAWRSRSE